MSLPVNNGGEFQPLLLKVSEVSKILRRSRARVYEIIHTGELKHIKDGRSILIPKDAVTDWIKKKLRQTES